MDDLKNIIECLLFVTDEPITLDQLRKILMEADTPEIKTALSDLMDDYKKRGGGFYLKEIAGGYQLRTRPQYMEWVSRIKEPSPLRLSKAALETLAIIAYRQPIMRSDIEHIRGVDSGGIIRTLLERKLVRVLGRKDIPGRPLIYATTKKFLELFDLKNLKDLPSPKEIEEMGELIQKAEAHNNNNNNNNTDNETDSETEKQSELETPVSAVDLPEEPQQSPPEAEDDLT